MNSCGMSNFGQYRRKTRASNQNTNPIVAQENVRAEGNTGLSDNNWCSLLSNFIGRTCECEFLLGDNLISRTGILNDVGTDFLILASTNRSNSDILLCDTCNLRFVRVE